MGIARRSSRKTARAFDGCTGEGPFLYSFSPRDVRRPSRQKQRLMRASSGPSFRNVLDWNLYVCVCVSVCVWVGTRYTAAQPAEDCAEPAQRQREKGRENLLILNLFFRASDPIRISEMSLNSTARPTAQPTSGPQACPSVLTSNQ